MCGGGTWDMGRQGACGGASPCLPVRRSPPPPSQLACAPPAAAPCSPHPPAGAPPHRFKSSHHSGPPVPSANCLTSPPCPRRSRPPAGPLPHQQYADLYREAGADGVGAMGSEPTCTLFTFAPAAAGVDAARAAPAGAATAGQPLLRLAHTLSCQPHKLLTCHLQPPAFGAQEPPTPDTHLAVDGGSGGKAAEAGGAGTPGGGQAAGPTLLLGLTDDVDCAVVAVSCADASDAGVGSSDAAAGGGDSGGGDSAGGGAGFVVRHAASIPALAYVAAGGSRERGQLWASARVCCACAALDRSPQPSACRQPLRRLGPLPPSHHTVEHNAAPVYSACSSSSCRPPRNVTYGHACAPCRCCVRRNMPAHACVHHPPARRQGAAQVHPACAARRRPGRGAGRSNQVLLPVSSHWEPSRDW